MKRQKRRRVVLSGYYGFGNAGDEAVLAAIVNDLRELDPTLEITVLSHDPNYTFVRLGVAATNREHPGSVMAALKGADLLISGGGSLLQDVTSQRSLPYYLGIVTLARLARVPVFFYAQGIGPVRGALGRLLMRAVANRVQAITVRDEESKALLRSLGIRRPGIDVTADPAFGWDPPEARGSSLGAALVEKAMGICPIPGSAPLIGIAARPWGHGVADEKDRSDRKRQEIFQASRFGPAAQALVGAIRLLREGLGGEELARAHYVLLPFYWKDDSPLAHAIAGELAREGFMPSGKLGAGAYVMPELTPEELLAAIGQMDLLVGMRLHALIFAATRGVPMVGIEYDPKVTSLLARLGQHSAGRAENAEARGLALSIAEAWRARSELKQRLAAVVPDLREQAKRTARLAMRVMAESAEKRKAQRAEAASSDPGRRG